MADDNNSGSQAPPILVRDSNVHGRGVFATRRIEKGERIIEYLGERVSHDEADRRYESKEENDSHTFLFIVDSKTVIDAGTDGNDARFFNHSCDPNCESVVEKRRVFIEALRAIESGEEMTYDYQIYRDHDDPENIDQVFACRCGFANCRGTMLWPPEPKKKKKRSKAVAKKKQPGRGGKSSAKVAKKKSAAKKKSGAKGTRSKVAKKKSTAKKKVRR
jgi:SET domain-containing protein